MTSAPITLDVDLKPTHYREHHLYGPGGQIVGVIFSHSILHKHVTIPAAQAVEDTTE